MLKIIYLDVTLKEVIGNFNEITEVLNYTTQNDLKVLQIDKA